MSTFDRRLKKDIQLMGTTIFKLPLYCVLCRDQPGTHLGLMAQDVLKVKPDAVLVGTSGCYIINHMLLGVTMRRIDQ